MKDTQLNRVRNVIVDCGFPRTLKEIAELTGSSEAAASARLRDLRKLGYEVACKKVQNSSLRLYTVTRPVAPSPVMNAGYYGIAA